MQEEHAAWVRNNEDGLRSAFAALQTEDAAHSHLFGAMTFEHFCVFANNERDSGEKRAAVRGGVSTRATPRVSMLGQHIMHVDNTSHASTLSKRLRVYPRT